MKTFNISEQDIEKVKKGTLISITPIRFNVFPAKEKRKYIIASFLVHEFEENKIYTELEVNDILRVIYPDFATVRRFMIDYDFIRRSDDCRAYWLNVKHSEFILYK